MTHDTGLVLFPDDLWTRLLDNGRASARAIDRDGDTPDHKPVVKIFNPYGGATWLLTECDPDDPDRLFGLCDLGFGEPELGYVLRSELESTRVPVHGYGLPLERDVYFEPKKGLSEYAQEASLARRIVA